MPPGLSQPGRPMLGAVSDISPHERTWLRLSTPPCQTASHPRAFGYSVFKERVLQWTFSGPPGLVSKPQPYKTTDALTTLHLAGPVRAPGAQSQLAPGVQCRILLSGCRVFRVIAQALNSGTRSRSRPC